MKFALCHECSTFAVPSKDESIPSLCACGSVAVTYTGNKNEIMFVGPATILAIQDEVWALLINDDAAPGVYNFFVIDRHASTVIDANPRMIPD